MSCLALSLETINTDAEHARLSGPKGWGKSVVLREVVGANQPKAVTRSVDARNPGPQGVIVNARVSGGFASQSVLKDQKALPRVLVIDDEDFIRDLYKDVFESSGMTVFSAQSGEEAVMIFKTLKSKPDVIIMDHRMPGKDGIETTKEILRIDPSIPIIFSSADETVREQALAAGAVSFWAKPFPVGLLVNAMIDLMEARKKREAHHFH